MSRLKGKNTKPEIDAGGITCLKKLYRFEQISPGNPLLQISAAMQSQHCAANSNQIH
jgi:hypothetical protein